MTLNGRKLPERRNDAGVLDTHTTCDAAGNPVQIRDDLRGVHYGRSMRYDGLDRLIEASSCSFGGDCVHRYSYDALDNIASWQLGGVKQHFYWYDSRNRLTNIRNEVGSAVIGLSYDPQGNLSTKNGQAFVFDFGNRLRSATGKESYQYDSQGRRVASVDANGTEIRSFYGLDGVLRPRYRSRITATTALTPLPGVRRLVHPAMNSRSSASLPNGRRCTRVARPATSSVAASTAPTGTACAAALRRCGAVALRHRQGRRAVWLPGPGLQPGRVWAVLGRAQRGGARGAAVCAGIEPAGLQQHRHLQRGLERGCQRGQL